MVGLGYDLIPNQTIVLRRTVTYPMTYVWVIENIRMGLDGVASLLLDKSGQKTLITSTRQLTKYKIIYKKITNLTVLLY